jgi:hypothetical protein
MASPNPILLRPEDFPGLVKASGGELDKLFRALNGNFAEMARALAGLLQGPQSPWVSPALLNGWVNYTQKWNYAGFAKDPLGWVHLRGLVSSGSGTVFLLPVGCRPIAQVLTGGQTSPGGVQARIDVAATGEVTPGAGTSPVWLSLDNISFRAEN